MKLTLVIFSVLLPACRTTNPAATAPPTRAPNSPDGSQERGEQPVAPDQSSDDERPADADTDDTTDPVDDSDMYDDGETEDAPSKLPNGSTPEGPN